MVSSFTVYFYVSFVTEKDYTVSENTLKSVNNTFALICRQNSINCPLSLIKYLLFLSFSNLYVYIFA